MRFEQLYKDNEKQFEMAKNLWVPFIKEMDLHEGKTRNEEEIIDGLEKRIAIQGLREDMHFEVMIIDEVPVGIAMYAIDLGTVYGLLEKGCGTVMGFFIRPDYRRKGYGTELWNHIECTLREDGATKFYLTPDAVTGLPFWKYIGFTDSGKYDPDEHKPIYIK